MRLLYKTVIYQYQGYRLIDLLVLDDYGLDQLGREQRHDLLEILEDRHGLKSTLVTSQLPIDHWHEQIGDPTLADAILNIKTKAPVR
jgi:DNA replication protein DnaC